MAYPASPYVEEREGGLYIRETRVSLDSVVIGFQRGESPEQIVRSFPTVNLFQAYGAIAYYLENQGVVDAYLAERRQFVESLPSLRETNPRLFHRLEAARRGSASRRP